MDIDFAFRAHAIHGERPGWHPTLRKLFWVNVREPALHAFDPATGQDVAWEMPAWIGCYGLTETGAVVALRTGFYDFDIRSGHLSLLSPAPYDSRRFFFNDGRCDRVGRFFAGPMYMPLAPGPRDPDRDAAPLWRFEPGGHWRPVSLPVKTSNGLAWSPDGRTLYHSDTEPKTIWACDYDEATGAVENRRVFAQVEVEDTSGGPDGAVVDRDGFYWCAVFANGCLLRFDPDGRLERRVPLPVKYPTMPALGGTDLKTLFVTSATWPIPADQRGRFPDEGSILALEAPSPGLSSIFFNPNR